jgi:methionyl-tRNA formyltransferase
MIVAAYGLILPATVLAIPRYGCINIHASLLPRWRGAAPIQRAILAGDTETGITVMQMDVGLDTGDMLHKIACPILPTDTAQTLHDRLAAIGAKALMPVLTQVQTHTLKPVQQVDALSCYAPKIDKAEAQMDWSKEAVCLDHVVRAYHPWPVAYTRLNNEPLRIWQAQALTDTSSTARPGTIIATSKQGIDVATGNNSVLRLLTIQLPGGKPVSANDLLNSNKNPLRIGTDLNFAP